MLSSEQYTVTPFITTKPVPTLLAPEQKKQVAELSGFLQLTKTIALHTLTAQSMLDGLLTRNLTRWLHKKMLKPLLSNPKLKA
jgi:hypothetical protein